MTRVFFLIVALGVGLLVADIPPKHDPMIESPKEFQLHVTPVIAGIRQSPSLVVYEGLPHQLWESEAMEKELKTKKTLKRHGFHFYEAPIKPSREDAAKLAAICSDIKNFEPWSGDKLCGEYHPDWYVEFKSEAEVYRVLICFGCSEARLYGPKTDVYSDLAEESLKKFIKILKPLRKERPLRE